MRRLLSDRLAWAVFALLALAVAMPALRPLFAAAFPGLERPMYRQQTFLSLLLSHFAIVALSSGAAALIGLPAAIFATRPQGVGLRPMLERLAGLSQTIPPVAVLALAVPAIGFGFWPAFVALTLYGLLPIVENALAGLSGLPAATLEAGRGLGMTQLQLLRRVELPLAAPVILAGIRVSVIVNVGTAAVASTVGVRTLGMPIMVGLVGSNVAYVLQGTVLVALLAVVLDMGFERLTPARR